MTITVPRGVADVRLVGRTVRHVLTIPSYAAVATVSVFAFLSAMAIWEHRTTFANVILTTDSHLPVSGRLELLGTFYPIYGDRFETGVELTLVVVAILVGINVSLLAYHVREHDLSVSGGGGSAFGVVLGVLGAGCAACGSALLLGFLSLIGAGGLVAVLPLAGLEFSLLAIAVLLVSTYWIADGMRAGEIRGCPIDGTS